MIYLDLFLGFLRVGFFAFGGAYGSIPIIRDVVLSYGWLTDEALTYMIAVSESTPGPIMVNLATYIGSSQAGIWGAILATFAVVIPSFLVILLMMFVFKALLKNRYTQAILGGLEPCIIGMILATGLFMMWSNCVVPGAQSPVDVRAVLISLVLAAVMWGAKPLFKKNISPIFLILLAAGLGIVAYGI